MKSRALVAAIGALWAAVLASAAGVVYAKHQARTLFVELERLSADRDRLNIEWGRLQIEQSFWSSPGVVEQAASRKLTMTQPSPNDVKIIQP
jgi:cell division protein FtsL